MRLMFEDNKNSVISKFLCSVYDCSFDGFCKQVIFLNGNTGLRNKIDMLCKEDESYIIYIDVVPDNFKSIRAYIDLEEYCKLRSNICVIPIPCIEYYIIKVYGDKKVNEIVQIFNDRYVKETELVTKILRGKYKSFEKYCKKVLDHCLLPCQKKDGRFYIEDCICGKQLFDIECISKTIVEKASAVITELPVFVYSDKIQAVTQSVTYNDLIDIKNQCIQLYYSIAKDFKNNGYIDSIIRIDI